MIKRFLGIGLLLTSMIVVLPLIGAPATGFASSVAIGRVHKTFQPERGKIYILVIGNDARAGNPNAARADALHLIGVNTETMRGGILNFPRDSYVNIPGHGSSKINDALYLGGPELVTKTVENVTGIRIDYYVMTGFEGFRAIIRGIGKVKIKAPFDLHDPSGSGINLSKGVHKVPAETALAYVRTRHSFPHGDIDRSTNQAKFLKSLLVKLHDDVSSNPASLLRWIAVGRKNVRLNISADELFRLAVIATQIQNGKIGSVTVPVSLGSVGASSVVFISPNARKIYARFKRTASL